MEPVGSDGGISDPLRFVPPAAAEEAYLVTELGNVFPVDDGSNSADTIIIQNSDNGTKRDVAALNLFLMGSNARIDGISPGNMKFVYGTDSKGSVAEYHPYFKIPIDVKNHTDGYVVLYHDDIQPSVTVPIRDLFSEYTYNPATETLHEVGLHGAPTGTMPNFASTETRHPKSSMLRSGTVTDTADGFSVSAQGTYVIKLPPGRAYWVNNDHDRDHDLECVVYYCDTVSIMSTDVDLLGSTSSGLALVVPRFSGSDGGGDTYGSGYDWSHKRKIELSTSFTGVQISNPSNVEIGGSLEVDFYLNAWCFIGGNEYRGRNFVTNATVPLSGFVPSTTTSNDMTFLNGGTATGTRTVYKSNFSPTGTYQDCDFIRSGRMRSAQDISVPTNTNRLYDRGFWVNEHLAHWSDAPASLNSNIVVNYTGYGQYIYDDYPAGVNSSAYVYDDGKLREIFFTIDVTHPDVSELNPITLTAPNGVTRRLNLSGNFTDGGSQAFPIPSWMRTQVAGNWELNVADDTPGNTGYLDGWAISITYNTAPMYPIDQTTRQDPFLIPVHGNDAYMVIDKRLPHGTIEVKSDAITSAMGLDITNLPSNTLYSITDDDGFEVYGTTGDSGEIILPNENSWASVINPTLKLFDDTFVIRNMAGMSVYDIQNDLLLHVPVSKFDGVVYGTTQYMKLPLMIDTTVDDVALAVDNCTIATLPLPHLARNYTTVVDKHIWIPVVPGLGTICITVDGTELVLRLEDFQSGNSAIAVPDQTYSTSSSPGFEFTGGMVPVRNSVGDPIENSAGVSSGAMYVAPFTGSMALKVSGSVSGEAETYTIREYSDASLTGNVADVEDGEIMVGVSVYKNGEYLGYTHLTTFRASGQEFETRHGTFPTGDGRSQWYHTTWSHGTPTSHAGWSKIKTELIPPWHHCDTIRYVHTSGHSGASLYYKCMYRDNPLSNSYCLLDLEYDVYGSFSGNARSFNVEAGDIIEYRISATMSADHNSFDCGNDNTGDYGITNVKITLRNVLFEHKGT